MKKAIAVTAAVLLGTVSFAMAQGASSYSPGHEMKNPKIVNKGPGASYLSPGHEMQRHSTVGLSRGTTRGASEFSPGDRMNDKRTR